MLLLWMCHDGFGNVHDNVNFAVEAERDPDESAILSLSASIETLTLSWTLHSDIMTHSEQKHTVIIMCIEEYYNTDGMNIW